MSKTSHNRHEHKNHDHQEAQATVSADKMNQDFSKRHKGLIIALVVVMIVILPLLFAAATLLRMVNF